MRYILVLLMTLTAALPRAEQFDMAAIQKWGAARVVHYEITGAYKALTALAPGNVEGLIDVTDGVSVSLDWDLRANAVIGQATFKNVTTKLGRLTPGHATECKPPTLDGPFEFYTLVSIGPGPAGVNLTGTRVYPDASVITESPASCKLHSFKASKAEMVVLLPVVSPMLALMPNGVNPNLVVAADQKSFTLKNKEWSWTYVPTIVK